MRSMRSSHTKPQAPKPKPQKGFWALWSLGQVHQGESSWDFGTFRSHSLISGGASHFSTLAFWGARRPVAAHAVLAPPNSPAATRSRKASGTCASKHGMKVPRPLRWTEAPSSTCCTATEPLEGVGKSDNSVDEGLMQAAIQANHECQNTKKPETKLSSGNLGDLRDAQVMIAKRQRAQVRPWLPGIPGTFDTCWKDCRMTQKSAPNFQTSSKDCL